MRVRPALEGDLSTIFNIERLCFPDETAFPIGMFDFLIRYARTIVAYDCEGEILGFAIGFTSGKTGIVYTLDVHPDHRRRGVGRMLMRELEELLRSDGAATLRLETATENPAAQALYLKEGYTKVALIKDYYGTGKDAFRMVKDLV